MSEIAGRLAAHAAATYLAATDGGPRRLLGGSPGVAPCRVVVIGDLGTSATRIRELDTIFGRQARAVISDPATSNTACAGCSVTRC
jgi:alanine dehydrogenase